jgi:golgi apyrase
LSHAQDQIPPSLQKDTPLFLLATAGMRLLPPQKQAEILLETCHFLVNHSYFKIDEPSTVGPCGSSVRIITGEEEGLFGWIAVNYLMNGFSKSSLDPTTYGFLDMGGASTQIAFEPSVESQSKAKNLIDVRLRLLGGEEIHHKVFVTTWLGYGTNQARERYVGKIITENDASLHGDEDEDHIVSDPCLPKDLELTEAPVHSISPATAHLNKPHRMIGTGSFEQCMKNTAPLLNTTEPCPDTPCLMNGVHVPPIDFSVSHFIGVAEYWYSSEHIFGLGGAYDYVQYERAASNFCSRDWTDILNEHEISRARHRLGGDGEVVQNGKVVDAGRWGPKVEVPRLQMQCFKAAWVANVLHEGIKMPRIVDPGGNVSTDGEEVVNEAEKKGLGKPTFQSVDTVGDIAISWTLGKMVLEASKEIIPNMKSAKPLVDPIDDIEDIEHFPIQPIRPPYFSMDAIEAKIAPHLPLSLNRDALGFSPVIFMFYAFLAFVILAAGYPMRRQIRACFLRTIRNVTKRDGATYGDLMEEGKIMNRNRPSSPISSSGRWMYPIRRFFSSKSKSSVSIPSTPVLRQNPARNSPTRSYSMPNGFVSSSSSSQYISRSPSPVPDESVLTSRSRNGSQINLSSMAPRSNAISRTTSGSGKGQT